MVKRILKSGFTIAELFLTLFVFAVCAGFAISVVFKTSNISKSPASSAGNYFICYEGKTENEHGGCYYPNIHGCNFELTNDMIDKEFFEIRLIGGGGGATPSQNGSNGEERSVNYPSLAHPFGFRASGKKMCNSPVCADCNSNGECTKCVEGYKFDGQSCKINFYYRAVLGEGGKVGENGGQTSLLVIDKSTGNILKILETAAGGIISNSTESKNSSIMNGTSSDYGSGNGGISPNGSGQYGEVRIQW